MRPKWLAIGAVAVLLGLVLRSSWVAEDAYITLRTVDNFVHGYGLRWNTDERVQAYTHPLWMLMLSVGYFITREAFVTTVFISVLTTAAAAFAVVHFARTAGHAVAAIVLLTVSRGFIEFSTSGLENPLSHLLIALFVGAYAVRAAPLWQLTLIAALSMCNRTDSILVMAPALLHASWLEYRAVGLKETARSLAIGLSPWIAWELFSLFYYGFPFPNTAYAKLNTGLPRLEVLRQGFVYWVNALSWDVSLHVIALVGVATAVMQRRQRDLAIALGLLLYTMYVINIGGDFMQGRFWTIPFFTGVCLLSISELPIEDPGRVAALILPVSFFLLHPLATEAFPNGLLLTGIADERAFFRDDSSLVMSSRSRSMPTHSWAARGRELRNRSDRVFVHENIGFMGFNAGPRPHIIDFLALSDPLLARLPMRYRHDWRIGHFARVVPDGYVDSVTDGKCHMKDLALCEYWGHLHEVVSGPLFSFSRIKTLIAMNLGLYEHLVDRERYRYPEMAHAPLRDFDATVAERALWNSAGTHVLIDDGLMIDLPQPSHAVRLEVSFDGNDDYALDFRLGSKTVGQLDSRSREGSLMHTRKLEVPASAQRTGFDHIFVRPERGDGMFSVGHVHLRDK